MLLRQLCIPPPQLLKCLLRALQTILSGFSLFCQEDLYSQVQITILFLLVFNCLLQLRDSVLELPLSPFIGVLLMVLLQQLFSATVGPYDSVIVIFQKSIFIPKCLQLIERLCESALCYLPLEFLQVVIALGFIDFTATIIFFVMFEVVVDDILQKLDLFSKLGDLISQLYLLRLALIQLFFKLNNLELHGQIIVAISPQRLVQAACFRVRLSDLASRDKLRTKCFQNGTGVTRAGRFDGILFTARARTNKAFLFESKLGFGGASFIEHEL